MVQATKTSSQSAVAHRKRAINSHQPIPSGPAALHGLWHVSVIKMCLQSHLNQQNCRQRLSQASAIVQFNQIMVSHQVHEWDVGSRPGLGSSSQSIKFFACKDNVAKACEIWYCFMYRWCIYRYLLLDGQCLFISKTKPALTTSQTTMLNGARNCLELCKPQNNTHKIFD